MATPTGVHNDFYNAVNGQLFEGQAPEGSVYPYAVYQIISAPKDRTFTEEYTDITLQLSIFSSASSSAEIKLAYYYASALFDECELTILGSTLVWMREMNMVPMMEDHVTPTGVQSVRHYAVDFEVKTSLD
jgi:hypothetical protein